MMSHSLCHFLLLVFLFGRAVVLVKASDNDIRCGYDNFCQITLKLMAAVAEMKNKLEESASFSELNEKLDKLLSKQVKDVEELHAKLDRSLTSTATISTQLEKHSADFLQLDERLNASDACPDVNEKLDKIASDVLDIHSKQEKGVEELKVKMNRSLTSTAAISTQLEKYSAEKSHNKSNDVCPDVNEKLDKIATGVRDIHSKQDKGVEELKVNMNRSLSSTVAISAQLVKQSANLLSHDERLKTHNVLETNAYQLVKKMHDSLIGPRDCSDIRALGYTSSGAHRVYPGSLARRMQADAYCDLTTPGGNWLVFQRRRDGFVNFERTWVEYTNGFGNPNGEFWLGNEALYLLTSNRKYKLRIDMEDFDRQKRYAEYSVFSISSSADRYRLTVGGYTGNAGDSLSYHNGMQFSTRDADNDKNGGSCAQAYRGAWWYNTCHNSNLNGLYLRGNYKSHADGVLWYHFRGHQHSLKVTEMKIAAVN